MKAADVEHDINEILKNRWSPRAFSERSVSVEDLKAVFEAARWSPSCYNDQPWYFIACTKENEEGYGKIFSTLAEFNQNWAKSAPVLIIAYAKINFHHNNKPNAWAEYDLGQAVAHLTFEAVSRGLYIHQMGGFSEEKVKTNFYIDGEYTVKTILALGYIGDKEQLPVDLQKQEEAARKRKDYNKVVKFV